MKIAAIVTWPVATSAASVSAENACTYCDPVSSRRRS